MSWFLLYSNLNDFSKKKKNQLKAVQWQRFYQYGEPGWQLKWKLQHMEESVPGWQAEAERGRTQPCQDSTTSQNSPLSLLHPGDTGWLGKRLASGPGSSGLD